MVRAQLFSQKVFAFLRDGFAAEALDGAMDFNTAEWAAEKKAEKG